MKIVMHTAGLPFDGLTIEEGKALGGSESASYFMAKELAKLGHELFVFTNSLRTGTWDDVTYEFMGQCRKETPLGDRFHFAMQVPHDVVIIQRTPQGFLFPYNSKLNVWWLHDLGLRRYGSYVQKHLPNIDQIFTVSNFHKNQISEVYDIPKTSITAIKNGVDYSLLVPFRDFSKEKRSLVFASRPERGLKALVEPGGIMERLPGYHLHVCGYSNMVPQMESFYKYLWSRCEELDNVINHGELGKKDLYELLAKSQAYVYPTSFEDTSNIMILESNAVGTPFIGFDNHSALQETGEGGGCKWIKKSIDYEYGNEGKTDLVKEDIKKFVKAIRFVCEDEVTYERYQKKALNKQQSWEDQAKDWEEIFTEIFSQKTNNKRRLYRHFEKYSDITAIKKLEDTHTTIKNYLPNFEENYYFFINQDFSGHYDRYYEYEEKRGVKYGPEDLTGNGRFEQTKRIIEELNPKSILDYGCAHGHYVMNLAKYFQDILFCGADINSRNIDIARKWKGQEYRKTIQHEPIFLKGGVDSIEGQNLFDKFDLILLGEILEHVEEPRKLVDDLKKYLSKDGWILITVPYGPWESIGYKEHKGWRAHIHHLERQDLIDMFGSQKNFKAVALPFNFYLGHYIVYFQPDKEFGLINYNRKALIQNPQETLSVCIIVKDGEHSLGRTLKSIENIADEIIIGVDETTSDLTVNVAKQFTYSENIFKIPSPLEIGFDQARMLTIEKATMDWILWIDVDETLENAENLKKYFCYNCFNGYGVKQHHYAIEPASLFKTDFPCRVFRNHIGMKFFGFVHEHPELKMNDGPGKTHLIEDVAIMHTGYATEAIRRKRFKRNFPLMEKDRKKYPARKLGKFLWVRDIAHYTRYLLEENGGVVNDLILRIAQEGVNGWRELLKLNDLRLICDSVPYYSECVYRLKNGNGIEFKYNIMSGKLGARFSLPNEIEGLFENSKDIQSLVSIVTNEITKVYDEEYF